MIRVLLPPPHPAQMEMISSPARFVVASCGRRFGKTMMACGDAFKRAMAGQRVWWVAPTAEITNRGWDGITRICTQVRPYVEIVERRGTRRVEFPSGGFIAFKSAAGQTGLRGEGLDHIIIDEAAYVLEHIWTEELRPALSDRRGSALFISTPAGRNWFWRAWLRGQSQEQWPEWASFKFPTAANPYIAAEEIEAAREMLAERSFLQEYLAEFIEDAGAVFRGIYDAANAPYGAAPAKHGTYIMGIDWGRVHDFTVIIVIDAASHEMVDMRRFNQIGYTIQRQHVLEMANKWHPAAIVAEANAMGEPNIEALREEGLPMLSFVTTAATKAQVVEALALGLESGDLSILRDEHLINELLEYTMVPSASGGIPRYSALPGGYDDCVISLALAWHGVVNQPKRSMYPAAARGLYSGRPKQ